MATLIIDSNIWAYYLDAEAPEHSSVVRPVQEALRSERVVINTVILMEVAHFLIKNLGPVIGRRKLDVFLRFPFTVVGLDYDLTLESIECLMEYSHLGIGGRDSTIIATMRRLGFKRIMTHDEALKRIDWLNVVDPVLEAVV
ncbi:TPA: type II toxin-antitoxin system VapC family toxin [Candidatus Bathyarchaeota archaeon]|nr:type II toxin-antitoxin system VapC family toxin [Candidatus Bathyarchaeota archaeon]